MTPASQWGAPYRDETLSNESQRLCVSSGCGELRSSVAFHGPVDHVRQTSLERPASFGGRLSFGDLATVVVLAAAAVADLADGDDMQGRVESPVATGVEAVVGVLAAGGFQGGAAGVAGEVVLGGEAGDVADARSLAASTVPRSGRQVSVVREAARASRIWALLFLTYRSSRRRSATGRSPDGNCRSR